MAQFGFGVGVLGVGFLVAEPVGAVFFEYVEVVVAGLVFFVEGAAPEAEEVFLFVAEEFAV